MPETLDVPRNEWFVRESPNASKISILWLPGGGKIAYFEEVDDFHYWDVDGSPREDLIRVTPERNRWLTVRLRRELLECRASPRS